MFEKQGRNVKLTKQGKEFSLYIKKGLKEIEAGKEYLKKEAALASGHIDIGTISSISTNFIPKLLQGFMETYTPNNYFSFHEGISSELINKLKNDIYDIVFCTPNYQENDIEFIPVLIQPLCVVVFNTHHLSAYKQLTLPQLQDEPIIIHSKATGMHQVSNSIFSEYNLSPKIVSEANEDQAILGLVSASIGCAIMCDTPNIHDHPNITIIPLVGHQTKRYVCAAYLKNKAFSPSVKTFIQYIKTHYESID